MIRSDDDGQGRQRELEPVDPKQFRRLIDQQRHAGEQSVTSGPPSTDRQAPAGPGARAIALAKRRLLPATKDDVVNRIRASFQDLTDVLGAIDRKIDAHNRTSERLETSVRALPELMQGLPAASETGVQLLEELGATLSRQTSLTRDVVQSVEQLALRVAQIPDALARFDTRLERQEEDQRRAADALALLQTSLAEMQAESARLQQQTLEQLSGALQADRAETRRALDADRAVLAEVLERGNRQSFVLTIVMIVVVAALATALLLR
ncbi:MAG: hypothetical protein IPM29_17610 [Planctomycetes bacterium]|nr:hypothetical protein [Planctomycetota bacterium]